MTAQPSTKAQLQMAESIIIVFTISIILILGIFVFYKYQLATLQEKGTGNNDQKITVLLATLTKHPALACNNEACIDTTKLLIFKQHQQNYQQLLGNSIVTVTQIYPETNNNKECTPPLYNQLVYPNNCNHWVIYNKTTNVQEKNIISTPIALYYPEIKEYRLGQLTIEATR